MTVEAELCAAAAEALELLGFEDFTIRLNHRAVLTGVLDAAGVQAPKHADALIALDKLDKIGRDGVAKELAERGIDPAAGKMLLDFFDVVSSLDHAAELALYGADRGGQREAQNRATIGRLVEFVRNHETGAAGIDDLRRILDYSVKTAAREHLKIDPSLARGLSYYTGAIMEIAVPDLAGSLGGGGRYDNLVGMFSGQDVPACGFSLGLERIIVVMTEREMFPAGLLGAPADVMVTIWNAETVADSIALATELRSAGLRVSLYPDADKLGKQFKYASSLGIPLVTVVGDDESARGEVTVKNMESGEQFKIARETAGIELAARLGLK
jgi:histidyl-tRNA synthetase